MLDTIAGIKTHFEGATPLVSLGTLWLDTTPEKGSVSTKLAPPYAMQRFVPGTAKTLEAFGLRYIGESQHDLIVVHTDDSEVATLIKAIKTRFDRQTFTIADGTLLACQRIDEGISTFKDTTTDSKDVIRAFVRYRVKVNRTF